MKKDYILRFPRGVEIDIYNVPENFEELIHKAFSEFTSGTSKDYTYQDKLYFIDLMRQYAHGYESGDVYAYDEVKDLIKRRFAWNLDEEGELTDESEFLSIDFMVECYEAGVKKGACNLYEKFSGDHRVYDRVMALLCRAIKVVVEWEPEGRRE